MSFPFDSQQGLIIVRAELWGPVGSIVLRLALDTGATGTVVNIGMLVTIGYDPVLVPDRIQITTGSRVEFVPRVTLDKIMALGQERTDFPVLGHTLPPSAGIDGLLGLDFFRGQSLTLDFRRRLDELEIVYLWADGLYVKAGLEDTKAALLVMIGVLTHGQKVILAVESGQRESKESWGMILRDLRKRGLKPWRCTIADGALGLWAALGKQYPTLAEQRCWNHGLVNVLDALPEKHQAEARTLLCAMLYAESQAACEALRAEFTSRYRKLAPKAVERLADDWERLVTFYQFPREHWPHLRTTNVVESPFAAVRLRTTAAKRFKKVENATALIWKILQVAESTFRKLKGAELLPAVYTGVQHVDGLQRTTSPRQTIAA